MATQTEPQEKVITITLTRTKGASAYIGYATVTEGGLGFTTQFEYFDDTDLPVVIEDALAGLDDLTGDALNG